MADKPRFLDYDDASGGVRTTKPEPEPDATTRYAGIQCPKCQWAPSAANSDTWQCSCGKQWNTFDTRGKCPKCGTQWKDTACPSCHAWSPHQAWYSA